MSPYMAKIIGQEDFVYVWTLGVEGIGDGQDKLVTIDVNPDSPSYGKVIHTLSVGGRNEAHHSGFTDDRRYLWAGGLDTSKIFIFDVHTDPAKPTLHKTITDFVAGVRRRGRAAHHLRAAGTDADHRPFQQPGPRRRTALVEYTNEGDYITTHWMPTDDNLQGAVKTGKYADGYGYDVRVLPRRERHADLVASRAGPTT